MMERLVAGVPAVFSSGDFGDETLIAPFAGAPFVAGVNVDNDVHTAKLGVNYRFNWGAPVVARY